MFLCKRNLTPLQRRSLAQVSVSLFLLVAIQVTSHIVTRSSSAASGRPAMAMGLASVLPVLLAVRTAGRYLSAEPDEFVRAVLVPLGLVNADLFLITTGLAFGLVQRSYR